MTKPMHETLSNYTSGVPGNCMEPQRSTTLIKEPPLLQITPGASSKHLELINGSQQPITPRHRDKWKTTTNGWKRTSECSATIDRTIGQTYSTHRRLPITITNTNQL